MGLLIRNGRIIDPANGVDFVGDLLTVDGKVTKIDKKIENKFLPFDCDIIDAEGLWVLPGFIDLHTHLREPGFTHKETISTGVFAAVKGGFTTICCMPNTKPVADNFSTISYIINVAKREGMCTVLPIGAITKGQRGEVVADISDMVKAGAVAITEDCGTVKKARLVKEAMEKAFSCGIPVFSHCQDFELSDGGVMNEGERSRELGLAGISADSEEVIVARDIMLARGTGAALHICHISTEGSVALVRFAKSLGVKVTAEVTPHHFTLSEKDVDGTSANYKMYPPLRSERDIGAIMDGLKDGTIDCIATDHAPHHEDEKEGDFSEAEDGIIGLETAFSLAFTKLYKSGILTEAELIEKLTVNPAKIIGSNRGTLSIGAVCDAVIIDPNKEYIVDVETFESMGRNSPFDGYRLSGHVECTIVKGNVVFSCMGN